MVALNLVEENDLLYTELFHPVYLIGVTVIIVLLGLMMAWSRKKQMKKHEK